MSFIKLDGGFVVRNHVQLQLQKSGILCVADAMLHQRRADAQPPVVFENADSKGCPVLHLPAAAQLPHNGKANQLPVNKSAQHHLRLSVRGCFQPLRHLLGILLHFLWKRQQKVRLGANLIRKAGKGCCVAVFRIAEKANAAVFQRQGCCFISH